MNKTALAGIILSIILILELKDHNKKVEQLWPDHGDQRQTDYRLKMTVSLYSHYFLLLIMIVLFVLDLIGLFVNK